MLEKWWPSVDEWFDLIIGRGMDVRASFASPSRILKLILTIASLLLSPMGVPKALILHENELQNFSLTEMISNRHILHPFLPRLHKESKTSRLPQPTSFKQFTPKT